MAKLKICFALLTTDSEEYQIANNIVQMLYKSLEAKKITIFPNHSGLSEYKKLKKEISHHQYRHQVLDEIVKTLFMFILFC